MSRTNHRREIRWSSPRVYQPKRPKQALQQEVEEELEDIRAPLAAWEKNQKEKKCL